MSGQALDSIRYAADLVLAIVPPALQVRPYTVTMEIHNWSGSRVGLGTETVTSFPLYNGQIVDGYYTSVKYRQVSQKDVVVSGGLLRDGDVAIGPIVFPYNTGTASGGVDALTYSPAATGVNEVLFLIKGPNYPPQGTRFKKQWAKSDLNVLYRLYLRATAGSDKS